MMAVVDEVEEQVEGLVEVGAVGRIERDFALGEIPQTVHRVAGLVLGGADGQYAQFGTRLGVEQEEDPVQVPQGLQGQQLRLVVRASSSRSFERRRSRTSLARISMLSRTPSRRSSETPTALSMDWLTVSVHQICEDASGARESALSAASIRSTSPPRFRSLRSAIVWMSATRYRPCGHSCEEVRIAKRPASTSMNSGASRVHGERGEHLRDAS